MQFVGMMHMKVDTPQGASKIIADGTLNLKQRNQVLIDSITRNLYNIDPLTSNDYDKSSFEDIITGYNARNGK